VWMSTSLPSARRPNDRGFMGSSARALRMAPTRGSKASAKLRRRSWSMRALPSLVWRRILPRDSILARLDVLLRCFHGEHLLVDHDALRDRAAGHHLGDGRHELRT